MYKLKFERMVNSMARLIDADKLMEEINNRKFGDDAKKMNVSEEEMNGFFIGYMEGLIKLCVPTAYDVEKVVEELEIERQVDFNYHIRSDYRCIINNMYDRTLTIVRKGGVE